MAERIVTGAYVRVWLATLAAFVAFGITLLAVPLYARDELAARDFAIGVAVGAASVSAVLFSPLAVASPTAAAAASCSSRARS